MTAFGSDGDSSIIAPASIISALSETELAPFIRCFGPKPDPQASLLINIFL
jgi:hypothetical protein